MNSNMNIKGIAALFACGAMFTACSEDGPAGRPDDTPDGDGESAYVVAGTVNGGNSTAAYLLTSPSLDEGEVTAVGKGLETDYSRAATWLFFGNKYLYRLSYNMGSDGTTVAFYLDDNGKLRQRSGEYSIQNFTAYGTCGNKIVTTGTAAGDIADEQGNRAYNINFTILDVENETTETKSVPAENFLGNGEYVMLAGLLEANGRIYAGVVPLGCSPYGVAAGAVKPGNENLVKNESGGTGGGSYTAGTLDGTQYPDECYVAIFEDDSFTNPVIVKTDKMSYAAGRMRSAYYQTVWAADNGDIYVFSSSFAKLQSDRRQKTTHPSSVMRIRKGTTEFDSTYEPFDIEAAAAVAETADAPLQARPDGSGGGDAVTDNSKAMYRCWHITDDYFLLQMYAHGINVMGTGATKMAIFKGEERTFRYVTGLPDESIISSFPVKNIYCENGVCYISVVTTDGAQPKVYKIDSVTATATPGLSVGVDEPGAIGKLIAK
ncbi:MAG: DUF4374 domain-containing protein [Bacteroides sp.]|nr:DUF4374 domain-containing protein [Bacteroides sp.]MCM1448323.1 DUF4374 domain-containing protein [Bacteroides sp.]